MFGVISALAMFAISAPELFVKWIWVIPTAKFILAGGLAGMGLVAKDGSTHSTPTEVKEAGWKE